jgi:diketogulonate reductase-like aldo/keto reductase
MMEKSSRFQGIPEIIYGTAFKFENTASLVEAALKAGFRAIDTAANKPQYRESLVGEGIAAVIASGSVKRSELYVCLCARIGQTSTNHSLRMPSRIDPDKV